MSCSCLEKIDKLLEKQKEKLVVSFSLNGGNDVAVIATMTTSLRNEKYLAHLVANYCPFCGKNYHSGAKRTKP